MKRHKGTGLSGLVAEVIQVTGYTGTQWIWDLCNGIMKGCIPMDWKSSVALPIYKGKGELMECGSYRIIKLLEHAMNIPLYSRCLDMARGLKATMILRIFNLEVSSRTKTC